MTDDSPSSEPGPDPTGGNAPGVTPDDDIDAILAAAESLATDVSQELGADEEAGTGERSDRTFAEAETAAEDIDGQLDDLEGLVETIIDEVGAGTSNASGEVETRDDASQSSDAGSADDAPAASVDVAAGAELTAPSASPTPGLGDDLLAGPQETDKTPTEAAAITANDLLPPAGLFATPGNTGGDFGVVGGGPEDLGGDFAEVAEDEGDPETEPSTLRTRAADFVVEGPPARIALSVVEKFAGLLELVDKPFSRLGSGLRNAIGILALATLGTSVIVFIVGLF